MAPVFWATRERQRAWGKWGLGGVHLARVRVGCVVACGLVPQVASVTEARGERQRAAGSAARPRRPGEGGRSFGVMVRLHLSFLFWVWRGTVL